MLDNKIVNMITCSKAPQIPLYKKLQPENIWLEIYWHFKRKKNILKPDVFEKGQLFLQIVNRLHENAPDPSKSCMGSKTMPYAWRKCANNTNNIKTQMNECIGYWTSKCIKPAQEQKKQNFRGTVASSQVDCKVFVFFSLFVPVHVWCTLKFKTFALLVPVQIWCTLKFKSLLFSPCAGLVHFKA